MNADIGRVRWLTLIAWCLFASGVLIQVLVPRLEISQSAFVIPPSLFAEGTNIRPDELVARDRLTQLISAILTVGGALALAYRYRHSFTRSQQ